MKKLKQGKLLLMSYPQYTGGKMIMNCLGMSRNIIPFSVDAYEHLINNTNDYEYRLNIALNTLPTYSCMTKWLSYEFSASSFYKMPGAFATYLPESLALLKNGKSPVQCMIEDISQRQLIFFSETPSYEFQNLHLYFEVFPNMKLLQFKNFKKFHKLAINKKSPINANKQSDEYFGNYCEEKYNYLKGDDWPDWDIFEDNNYNVNNLQIPDLVKQEIDKFYIKWPDISDKNIQSLDVDNSYFNKDNFLKSMEVLYNWLECDDFNPNLIGRYYDEYWKLHND